MTRDEQRRRRRETLRGYVAFLLAERPEHFDTPYDGLLSCADAILRRFVLTARAGA